MPSAVNRRLLVADALEDRVGAEAACELPDALDRFLAPLAHDVGRAERLRERDPVGMTAEDDDLLRAEASGGDHAAEPDGAVADDRDGPAGTDLGGERRVVARRHHVGEREQRRHQRVVLADGQDDERALRLRHPDRLALAAVDSVIAVPAAVEARGVQSLPAEDAGAVGVEERRDDDVAGLDRADVGADGLDDADELVSHAAAAVVVLHRLVRPEVAAADRGAGDDDEGVGRLDECGVGDALDPNVARAVHDGCAHVPVPFA
jgi:hypothetical protein